MRHGGCCFKSDGLVVKYCTQKMFYDKVLWHIITIYGTVVSAMRLFSSSDNIIVLTSGSRNNISSLPRKWHCTHQNANYLYNIICIEREQNRHITPILLISFRFTSELRIVSAESVPVRMFSGNQYGNHEMTYTWNRGEQKEFWLIVLRIFLNGEVHELPQEPISPALVKKSADKDEACCEIL